MFFTVVPCILMPSNSFIYQLMHNRGSPISSTIAEIYLQFLEEIYIKQWLESKEIICYKRYVDDIFIIFYQNKTNQKTIINHMNNRDIHLEFKISAVENNSINYLDLSIHRTTNSTVLGIYRNLHTLMLPYNFLPTTLTNTILQHSIIT